MRKVTNSTIVGTAQALPEFKNLFSVKAPSKLLTAVALHEDDIVVRYKAYEKARVSICEQLADKDENGKPEMIPIEVNGEVQKDANGNPITKYKLSPENSVLVEQQIADLGDAMVDVQSYQLSLDDIKDFNVEPAMFPHISPFLKYFVKFDVE